MGVFLDRTVAAPPKTLSFVASAGTNQVWTNMPAAQMELFGSAFSRQRADLTGYTQFRLVATQAVQGASTASLRAQYSTDGSNFANLQDSGTTGDLGVGTGTGAKSGAWATVAAFARTDVHLRIMGSGGDGAADPAFRFLALEFKP